MNAAHFLSISPLIKAAIAYENETDKPTYPMYKTGGWKARSKSCNIGFNPKPSLGINVDLWNGFEVNIHNDKNREFSSPWTEDKREWNLSGNFKLELIALKKVSIKIHNKSEPSWLAQVPEIL